MHTIEIGYPGDLLTVTLDENIYTPGLIRNIEKGLKEAGETRGTDGCIQILTAQSRPFEAVYSRDGRKLERWVRRSYGSAFEAFEAVAFWRKHGCKTAGVELVVPDRP